MAKIKTGIIDDQRLFRGGLALMLKNERDIDFIGEYENGRQFLDALPQLPSLPQVMLVDMNMPGMNGPELTDILQREYPEIKIIILSVYDQERFIAKMITAGASGYLLKNCDIEEVLLAVRTTARSGFYFNEGVMNAMKNSARYTTAPLRNLSNIPIELTEREKEILQLICKELTNAEIADQLFISSRTVDGHRNNLLAKTGCRNTAGLVLFAVSNNIIDVLPS